MSLLAKRLVEKPHGYDELMEEARRAPYLARYLEQIIPKAGVPSYYPDKLPGELKKKPFVNVIYPVGEGVYIHVYMPPEGTVSGYRKYVSIEPPRPPQILFNIIEDKIAEIVSEKDVIRDPKEKREFLLRFLERTVDVVDEPVDYNTLMARKNLKRIPVYRGDYDTLKYYLIRDKVGLGILEPLIRDPYIEDISCDGIGFIYIVHKIFGPLETNIEFKTQEELDRFILKLSERIGKPVSHAKPIVDATLPDGSRINIVFGTDVSLRGSNFTIRKFSKKPLSVIQLIKWGTLDERIGAYLWILLLEGMSGFISGETASGKTTTLNAIIAFIRPTAKIVTIEDTAEVQVPHSNWVRELTRDTGSVESSITMFDLLKAALRQRPNYIIVGEIRGAEGNVAFQAMQSVSWDTPVMIMDERTKMIQLMPIGEFVDRFYKKGEESVPKPVNGFKVLSMDRYGRVVWSNIKYVLRHRASEVYEIVYEDGGRILATGSHSVFVFDEENVMIVPKPVTELRKGDLLVGFVRNMNNHSVITLNSLNNNDDYGAPLCDGAGTAVHYLEIMKKYTYMKSSTRTRHGRIVFGKPTTRRAYRRRHTKQARARSRSEQVFTDPYKAAMAIWFSRLNGIYTVMSENKLTETTRYYKVVTKYDEPWKSIHKVKLIPLRPLIKVIEDLRVNNTPEYIEAYIERFHKGRCRFVTRNDAERIIEFIERYRDRLGDEHKRLIDRLRKLMDSDIVFHRVIEVKRVKYSGYVYDISVPGTELFLGGNIPIALHNTGHPVLATFHAGSVVRLIQRITSPPINVPKTQLDNLNFVIIQSAVYREGVMLRRMLSVNEILGYDAASDSVIYIPVFTWDPTNDRFLFRGRGASYLLEEKVATMRGVSRRNIKLIYDELELRAAILREMAKRNIIDYYDVFAKICKIYGLIDEKLKSAGKEETQYVVLEGLEEALRKLRRGEL